MIINPHQLFFSESEKGDRKMIGYGQERRCIYSKGKG